jgi:hypothetical protein
MSDSNNHHQNPGAANGHTIALTICNLCGEKFSGPSALVVGQPAIAPYLERITMHFMKRHKKEENACAIKALEFLGMLRLMNFRTADPDIGRQLDYLRWSVHQQTLAARIPDDKLIERTSDAASRLVDTFWAVLTMSYDQRQDSTPEFVQALKPALIAEMRTMLEEIFRGIRDVLQEPNKYPAPTGVIPAGTVFHS